MHALPPTAASRHPRAGLSLLEVLVACGILAIGLASVSALLPAASARLGQATEQDRAGVLAANARAECVNRGLVAADIFSSATTACVFGELAGLSERGVTPFVFDPLLLRMGVGVSGSTSSGDRYTPAENKKGASSLTLWFPDGMIPGANPPRWEKAATISDATRSAGVIVIKNKRYTYSGLNRPRTFTGLSPTLAEDIAPIDHVIVVNPSTAFQLADDPAFRWGAMLTPESGTAAAGMPATLSIAVFRGAPTISGTIRLTGTSTSPRFELTTGGTTNGLANEANRRQFLPACSHAVALTNPPRWVRVTSSWTMPGFVVVNGTITSGTENVNARRSFVVLDPNPLTSGTTVNVIGFDGLLRVDHHPVTLD